MRIQNPTTGAYKHVFEGYSGHEAAVIWLASSKRWCRRQSTVHLDFREESTSRLQTNRRMARTPRPLIPPVATRQENRGYRYHDRVRGCPPSCGPSVDRWRCGYRAQYVGYQQRSLKVCLSAPRKCREREVARAHARRQHGRFGLCRAAVGCAPLGTIRRNGANEGGITLYSM